LGNHSRLRDGFEEVALIEPAAMRVRSCRRYFFAGFVPAPMA